MFSKLQYISQGLTPKEQIGNIQEALDAGCTWIQLRFKNADEKEFIETAEAVKAICCTYKEWEPLKTKKFEADETEKAQFDLANEHFEVEVQQDKQPVAVWASLCKDNSKFLEVPATFIINDHAELAKKIDSNGVHLGLKDMSIEEARRILGPNKIIGGSANTLNDVMLRIDEKCDYIGLGPYRFTTIKEKLSPVISLGSYKFILDQISNMNIPVYAIGGICAEDVDAILKTGIYGVAVSGAITNSANKKVLIQEFNRMLYETVENSR